MAVREQWANRRVFILAAIGSAIGLGNLWRFPFKCYENGGGAFLVAYFIALFTAGIPILLLEFGLGHKFKLAAPSAFKKVGKKFEWLGWWAVLVGFVIVTYYAVVMAWSVIYTYFSVTQEWGADPTNFFFNDFLGLTDSPFNLGKIQIPILIGLVISWVMIVMSIWKGAKTVSKVVYATVVLPWILLVVFVIRGVTLPGAMVGISYYLTPVFSKLLDPSVWAAAYGQIFYSVSIGFGIMIAYSSFLPEKSNITSSALIIGISDTLTAFIGGFAVFGTLGYYAQLKGVAITEVLKGGPGLAFCTYPAVISKLPLPQFFGILFFVMLLTLAVDSAFSLVEAVASAVQDKWNIKHRTALLSVGGISFIFGLIFVTGAGLLWLDIVDHFMEHFGLIAVVLVECIVLGWFYKTDKLKNHLNRVSTIKIGNWWIWFIKIVIPAILLYLLISQFVNEIKIPYEGYPQKALILAGWLIAILLPILGIIFAKIRKKRDNQKK